MINDRPIFLESIKFIKSKLTKNNFNRIELKVLERLSHTSGDFQIQELLEFSENVCERTLEALKLGAPILTDTCLLYTSPSPRDRVRSRMPSSA